MECEAAEVGRRKMMAAGTLGGGGKKAVQSLDSFSDGVRWRPPAFLLKGMRLTSDGGRVYTKDYLLALRASQMAQDGQEASGGSLPSPKSQSWRPPAPPLRPPTFKSAKFAFLQPSVRPPSPSWRRSPPGTPKPRPKSSAWPASSRTPGTASAPAAWR
jgi:hypothetical protein